MIVYFTYGEVVKRICGVTLEDCIRPRVGNVTEERVECALWYKVLVLDSLVVDCGRRAVYWTIQSPPEDGNIHACPVEELKPDQVLGFFAEKEILFEDGMCYDDDPTTEELFDSAQNIFNKIRSGVTGAEVYSTTYQHLIRMLHVYILPKIKFHRRDETHLTKILQRTEQERIKLEHGIRRKDGAREGIENALRAERDSILRSGDIRSPKYISAIDKEFLEIFLKHLEKDILQWNFILDGFEEDIAPLRNKNNSVEEYRKLADLRTRRGDVVMSLNSAIAAREEIKNVMIRKHGKKQLTSNKKRLDKSPYLRYVEMTKVFESINKDVSDLFSAKTKVSSVREAVKITLREIAVNGASVGFHRVNSYNDIGTNPFHPTRKPEDWATLNEKVNLYLMIKQMGFWAKLDKFCTEMKQKCQLLFDELELFSPAECDGNAVMAPRNSVITFDCETLCNQIIEHISAMAYEIADEIQVEMATRHRHMKKDLRDGCSSRVPRSLHNRVYICYEEHVSAQLMPVLCEFYEHAYKNSCSKLHAWISNSRWSMCDYWQATISTLLGQPSKQCSNSCTVRTTSSESPRSTTGESARAEHAPGRIQSMNIEQMYTDSNDLDQALPGVFPGALEFNTNPSFPDGEESTIDERRLGIEVDDASTNNPNDSPTDIQREHCPEPSDDSVQLTREVPQTQSNCCIRDTSFYKEFKEFSTLIKDEDAANTLFGKRRLIGQAMQSINTDMSRLRKENGYDSLMCSDDFLDVIVILLCGLGSQDLHKLYAHISLMVHLTPGFLDSNACDYALATFGAAYQHLFYTAGGADIQ